MIAAQRGYKEINGIQLYYEIYGEGKPLTLIHGGGSSGFFDFEETIKRLSGGFQLITIDLQNHGRSGHRDVPQTFEQDAKDVAAALEALGITKSSFFGFSNGATTVLQIAHLFPGITDKIIIASGVTKREGLVDGFFEMMQNATIDQMPAYFKENFLKLNPDESFLKNMFYKDSQRMIHFRDWEDSALASIAAPAFFIAGDKDVITAAHIAAMGKMVPDSRLMILPCGHGTYMMADETGVTDSDLIDFTMSQIRKFVNS